MPEISLQKGFLFSSNSPELAPFFLGGPLPLTPGALPVSSLEGAFLPPRRPIHQLGPARNLGLIRGSLFPLAPHPICYHWDLTTPLPWCLSDPLLSLHPHVGHVPQQNHGPQMGFRPYTHLFRPAFTVPRTCLWRSSSPAHSSASKLVALGPSTPDLSLNASVGPMRPFGVAPTCLSKSCPSYPSSSRFSINRGQHLETSNTSFLAPGSLRGLFPLPGTPLSWILTFAPTPPLGLNSLHFLGTDEAFCLLCPSHGPFSVPSLPCHTARLMGQGGSLTAIATKKPLNIHQMTC